MTLEHFEVESKLGVSLAGLANVPTQEPLGIVFLLHGFTGQSGEVHIEALAQDLESAGLIAIRFDAPGYGNSGGTIAEHYRFSNYFAAVSEVVAFARSNFGATKLPAGLWGHSMGGNLALIYGSQYSFGAVCACQPSLGMDDLATQTLADWEESGTMPVETETMGEIMLPYDFYLDRQSWLPKKITGVNAPSMIVAGTQDNVCPPATVKQAFGYLNEPKTYVEFPITHDYKLDSIQLAAVNKQTVSFFVEHLG